MKREQAIFALVLGLSLSFFIYCEFVFQVSFISVGPSKVFQGFLVSLKTFDGESLLVEADKNDETIAGVVGGPSVPSTVNTQQKHLFKDQTTPKPPDVTPEKNNDPVSVKDENLEICPMVPPGLQGRLKVLIDDVEWKAVRETQSNNLDPGGHFKPSSCTSRSKVAIILPYRNREQQLKIFLNYMHPILQRQQLEYQIYVVNQAGESKFNRAMLFNVGYAEAMRDQEWECFIFHDVDLLPEDDRNLYSCPETPRHMSVAVNTMNYRLPYATIFGGVSALSTKHFQQVNGFSNLFWGWGGEDDDMFNRIKNQKLKVARYSEKIARYTMIKHKKEKANKERVKILNKGSLVFDTDGLNNLQYNLVSVDRDLLFTNVTVKLYPVEPLSKGKDQKAKTK